MTSNAGLKTRFAPSPTGPLHLGSLVAALGSYLAARSEGGQWHVRIDDIDPPREQPGAADSILRALEACALHWDGPVVYQSQRHPDYQQAIEALRNSGMAYPCACTRKEIAAVAKQGVAGAVYPGFCRDGIVAGRSERAVRVRVADDVIDFVDLALGRVEYNLSTDFGDFVIRRSDGLFAYHLACVVDDAKEGFSHIIRGRDLVACTPSQIYLQRLLGLPTPYYRHLPLATDEQGKKLSKQTQAKPIDLDNPAPDMLRALQVLGYDPPKQLVGAPAEEIVSWAINC
ncbi:tRNA glutamyl-Q(34) synthetase GluQRS [Halorhodospira halochloris]|uniref:tRNA glutamyl-Q(34) synthetase GluQRS n=1 Tax=Halorhodospira halochloris TaxID=1052 RepID=UPI001EE93CED|nr:tRNA glutamyl-Q(34) synthetase GluQRS [Halorhodospira halochloris]MCG5547589.1 tRNA glutamyl-Q(34) synthetase GluQRS [Halorhodospira halochloris]